MGIDKNVNEAAVWYEKSSNGSFMQAHFMLEDLRKIRKTDKIDDKNIIEEKKLLMIMVCLV